MSNEAHDVSSRGSATRAARRRARMLLSMSHREPDDVALCAGAPARWRWAMIVDGRRAWRHLLVKFGADGLLNAETRGGVSEGGDGAA